jgi:methyl-accepting chemotaxis protein
MGEAMQTVREISGEVLALVKDIARGSSLISQSTMAVNQLTAELDNTAQRLDQEIHRFKTN